MVFIRNDPRLDHGGFKVIEYFANLVSSGNFFVHKVMTTGGFKSAKDRDGESPW